MRPDGDALRRMQWVATGLLALAALVFLLTPEDGPWGYLHATAEAAMVGAIADWFAVTALFRHPLGIPVPHTAIIPRRKDEIGAALESFVATNFLTPDTVTERWVQAGVTRRVAGWASDPDHARTVVTEALPALRRALRAADTETVRELAAEQLLPRLAQEPLAPLAGRWLQEVLRTRSHHRLVDLVVDELVSWLEANPDRVQFIVRTRAPWWSPQWVDDAVVSRIHAELLGWTRDVQRTPDHRIRASIDDLLGDLARDLQHDEATAEAMARMQERILTDPSAAGTVAELWEGLATVLTEALADPDGPLPRRLALALADGAGSLAGDPRACEVLDRRSAELVAGLVERHGAEVASVISGTVERWDAHETSRLLESYVGRDLQFIRINGTVVGGLVGFTLHAFSQIL
ncbi:DUF445 domain-containing protein [Kytococcus sedentarius]|uniref:DUF445 domain-containing protein n=1 Tax=Kytococcus sedentarius TaxID=1276 RepID=UPI001EF17459|nr:DUF445 domain-containing protein [Kytococcus sedentarius]